MIFTEQYFENIFNTVHEALLVLDSNLTVISANHIFFNTFKVVPAHTIGRYIYDLGNGQWNIPALRILLEDVLQMNTRIYNYEIEHNFEGIGTKNMLINASKIIGNKNDLQIILFAIEDVTEQKDLYKSLQNYARELEIAYKEIESFSYSISHDLRAPLRIIDGLSDIVLKDYNDKLGDEGKKLLNLIRVNTKRMDQLVVSLLDLSRIGRQEMKISEIDMEKAASLIAADLKAATPERNITVTIKELPPAYGDLILIRQVLKNLLSNAFKFTREMDVASIEVGGREDNQKNIYYVKDNGAGFNMEYADKLFKVFHRLHSLNEFEGIGIGLSIVQRIVQRHGGETWAEGKVNEGATFYFSLPSKKD